MNGIVIERKALDFMKELESLKKSIDQSFPWYPYGILNNFIHLKPIFNQYPIDMLVGENLKVLDIGAADGDLAFFLESVGYQADILDFSKTNYNHLRGAQLLKDRLNSSINIYERDLDSQFPTISDKYGLIFFLGILYHLKNPYYLLERLNNITKHLIVSTRIAKYTPGGVKILSESLAYLLASDESNNDSTNYWIFSYKGLERIFERTGWEIMSLFTVGDTVLSNPADNNHDERAFALLKSKNFH